MKNLNEDETKILKWFEKFPPESKFRVNHVASALSISLMSAHFYITRLVEKNYLQKTKLSRRNFLYSLNTNEQDTEILS